MLYKGYVRKRPKHEPIDSYFYLARQLAKCMGRTDAFNLHVQPVRTEITGMQQILILRVCDSNESESKEILLVEILSQVYSTDYIESESVIFNEISTEENESESVHKSINRNKEKYSIDETEYEKPLLTDNPVINEPRYFNLFEYGNIS